MAMKEQLATDLKEAMRAGDNVRRDTLRLLLTAISNAEIARVDTKDEAAVRTGLDDAGVIDVIQKQAKQRRDSIDEYGKAGRQDLVNRETAELGVLQGYLPEQMSPEEIAAVVREVIAETGASGPRDKGKVMPAAMARLRGRAEGRAINEAVTELLGKG